MFMTQKPADDIVLDDAHELIAKGWFSAAFLLLKSSEGHACAEHLFALGICLYRAEEYASAAEYFENSLGVLRKIQPLGSREPKNEIYRKLRRQEIADRVYLMPLKKQLTEMYRNQAKENITLALADALFRCGDTDKAKRFINSLDGEEFQEIKLMASQDKLF